MRWVAGDRIVFHKLEFKRRLHDWIIGYEPLDSYITCEQTGHDIIKYLEHHTIGEARKHFNRHDVDAFLDLLESKGFIHKAGHKVVPEKRHVAEIFSWKPEKLRWSHSRWVKVAVIAAALFTLLAMIIEPKLVPTPLWFFASPYQAVLIPSVFILAWVIGFFHELAHYIVLRATGHHPKFSLISKYHFLLPHTNLESAEVLDKKRKIAVYMAGMSSDVLILTISTVFIMLGIGLPFWKLVSLIAFVELVFHFTPTKKSDIVKVAESVSGLQGLNSLVWKIVKKSCPGCGTLTKEEKKAANFIPFYIVGVLVLVGMIVGFIVPIIWSLIVGNAQTLAASTNASTLNFDLFVDSFLTLLLLGVFLSFYFVAILREHELNDRAWFAWIAIFMHVVINYFIVFMLATGVISFTTPIIASLCLLLAGLLFGGLFLRLADHVGLFDTEFAQNYFYPTMIVVSVVVLIVLVNTVVSGTVPAAIYSIVYGLGMLAAMLI